MAAEQPTHILRLLGIDVWVQRQAVSKSASSAAPADPPDAASLTRELPQTLEGSARPPRPERAPEAGSTAGSELQPPPSLMQQQAAANRVENDLPACRIAALQLSGGLLLTDGADLVLARRLGRDLMASSAGRWKDRPRETVFDWQPEKMPGVAVSGRRALAAFVSKQLDDLSSGSLVLACAEVQGLLADLTASTDDRGLRLCRTTSLMQLATDTQAKRALWTQIQQLTD